MEKKRYVHAVFVDVSNEARIEMGVDCMGMSLLWGVYTNAQRAQKEAVVAEKHYRYKAVFSTYRIPLNRACVERLLLPRS